MVTSTGEDKVEVRVTRPPYAFRDKYPLTVGCVFKSAGTEIKTQAVLRLLRTRAGLKPDYKIIAAVKPSGVRNGLSRDASIRGEIKQGGESYLSVKFPAPGDGYCYYYRCVAIGKNSQGQYKHRYRTYLVNDKNSRSCKKPAPAPTPAAATTKAPAVSGSDCSSCQAVKDLQKEVQDNALKIQKLQALLLQASPLKENYLFSGIFDGSVYLLSKKSEPFDLKSKNDQCEEAGGNLVELDSKEEQDFVAQFAKAAGRDIVGVGASDVDKEGTFVQYNSKKPLPKLEWRKGEPNNYGGRENCVNINIYGLNDFTCSRSARYLCEIPLL
ncbi:Cd209 antigen [Plakobranchus ocellatus]|uniref:Cd209 antigen n=1 Tax=Plakobranchus ocellatus TaxID=259542 RepID=A0AAV3Y5W7_9GAST|nr:Cd209 antigen [Plakobranchus ocellatus]